MIKTQKRSVFGEIYTTGKKIYTASGSDGSDKSHLCPISVKSATYNSDLYVGWDWKAGFIDGCNPKLWPTHIFRSIHTPEIWQKQAKGTSCKFWNYVHSWDVECQVVVSDIHYLKTINYIIAPAADQSRKCKKNPLIKYPSSIISIALYVRFC